MAGTRQPETQADTLAAREYSGTPVRLAWAQAKSRHHPGQGGEWVGLGSGHQVETWKIQTQAEPCAVGRSLAEQVRPPLEEDRSLHHPFLQVRRPYFVVSVTEDPLYSQGPHSAGRHTSLRLCDLTI